MNNITANNYYNFGPNNGVNQRPARVGHLNAVINALNQGGSGGVTWGSITGTLALQTDLQLALDNKVDKNALITGATKTKITYDAKGLVTAGADATTADIADSTNKRYVTDANLTVIGNTSGTNSGNQTLANTSDATSHTATLSATGGSVKLVEGSGITLTTTGTTADGIITIASMGGGGTPSGVSGSVQFSNGSAFASDATNFFWDDTNDRLGIGTNTPSDRLTILGNSTSPIRASLRNTNANGDTQISLKNDTTGAAGFQVTGTTYFGNPSAYFFTQGGLEKLSFTTDGDLAAGGSGFITFLTGGYNASQERMRILSTGNIGINSTTATSKLVIKGSGTTSGTSSLNVTDSSANSILFVRDDGKVAVNNTTPVAGIPLTINDFFGGGLAFQTNGSTKTYFVLESVTNGWMTGSVAGDLCLRHTNQNILIGYSVGAQITVRPTGDTYIGYTPPNTANYGALNLGNGLFNGAANSFSGVAAGTALAMNFLSGATSDFINLEKTGLARFKVTHDGNVGVGLDSPTAKIHVVGSGTTSSTSSLNIVNSASTSLLYVGDDGKVGVGTTSPQSNIQITGGTLAGDSFTKNFLNVTGTFAATSSAGVQAGVYSAFTTAGSTSFQSIGNYTNLAAGYTGINSTVCLVGDNAAASAGTLLQLNLTATTPSGNTGVVGQARGTTIGNCIGTFGEGSNGLLNIGAMGKAITSKNSGVNIGMAAFALNQGTSPIQVGGYFGLQNASPNFSSAALICDNGLTTSDIFVARDNGTAIFNIIDNGNVGVGITAPTAKIHIKGTGATSATSSVLVQNSSSNQTFSVRDDGVVFVGLGGLAVGSAKFQVKDQSDNVCISVAQSDILFGNSAVLRSNDGIMYPTGNITFRNGNPNSAVINFGDSEVNSVSATGVFSFIKFTRNWTSVAPSLNLSINVQETQNVINMTNGTGTKIFRGIYHNPTVTAVTSHRAFESTSGGGHFNTTSVNASSVLQADSTTQGFLPPRMTNAQRAAIVSPAEGLLVHNTTNKGTAYYDGTNWGYLNGAAQTIAGSGGTVNIPFAAGNIVDLTLTASTTLTFSGHVVGVFILKVIQGGTGSYTLTYPASVKWSGGTPPTLTTTVGKTDIITLFHDGTNFFGTYSLNY